MRHATRSPLTGRFIAKRSNSTDLVEDHNKATRKRRLWDLLDAIGVAVLFGMVGVTLVLSSVILSTLVWSIALVLRVFK